MSHDEMEFLKAKLELLNHWHEEVDGWRVKTDISLAEMRTDVKWLIKLVPVTALIVGLIQIIFKIIGG